MITKFGTLFAGGVDMENIGLDGTPCNDRSFSDEYLATPLYKTETMAKLMDQWGYDAIWLAEHHFQPEGYECIPNILLFSMHLAHITKNLRIGCGFNISPMWHPLRLAGRLCDGRPLDQGAGDIRSGAGATIAGRSTPSGSPARSLTPKVQPGSVRRAGGHHIQSL